MKGYKLDAAGLTDRGIKRDHNEDAWAGPPSHLTKEQLATKGQIFVVADGVGGHLAGDVASQMAVEIIQQRYYADPSPDVASSLADAIQAASDRIGRESAAKVEQRGMSTTVTAAVLHRDRLTVANVGDSRAFLISAKEHKNSRVRQITIDHTWVEEQVQAGLINRKDAARHPQRNIITRSLGSDQELLIDIFEEQVELGDSVLLCSDGLSNMVAAREIGAIVHGGRNAQAIVRQLVDLANRRGAPDNVTAVLLSVQQSTVDIGKVRATAIILGFIAGVFAWVLLTSDDGKGTVHSPLSPLASPQPQSAIESTETQTQRQSSVSPVEPPHNPALPTSTPLPLDSTLPTPSLILPPSDAKLSPGEALVFSWQWQHKFEQEEKWRFIFELQSARSAAVLVRSEFPLNQRGFGLNEPLEPGEYEWRLWVEGDFRRGEAAERRLVVVEPTSKGQD